MKRKLLILLVSVCGTSFALKTVNLNQQVFTCNGQRITLATPESTIEANCKVKKVKQSSDAVSHSVTSIKGDSNLVVTDDDPDVVNLQKIIFHTDSNQLMYCYYQNNILKKCKIKALKSKPATSSGTH
jgi:type VI protein secretion system component Hcp